LAETTTERLPATSLTIYSFGAPKPWYACLVVFGGINYLNLCLGPAVQLNASVQKDRGFGHDALLSTKDVQYGGFAVP
jgi:hypothetical protein